VGRFFVEGLRIDSLMLGTYRAAQVMSLLLVAGCGIGLLLMVRRK
jgi:prolipoprotein diacylglyceryltransferase